MTYTKKLQQTQIKAVQFLKLTAWILKREQSWETWSLYGAPGGNTTPVTSLRTPGHVAPTLHTFIRAKGHRIPFRVIHAAV